MIKSDALYERIACKCNKILSEIRGEETAIFFHTIRHSRIECLTQGTDTRLIDKDGNIKKFPIEQVMVFAHHQSSETTMGYLKNHQDDTINEMFGFTK